MMEEAVVADRNSDGASLMTSVPVQMVTEARVEVVSKMTPVAVSNNSVQQDLMSAQYINIHRVPAEQLNKVLMPDALSGDLLTHHVDLTTAADFTQHGVATQYYDTDDLLTHDLTEDDRRLAAELVAVQFKHQQQHQQQNQILPTSIAPLGTVQTVNMDKPTISAAIVTSYIQAVEEEVHQQLLEQQENNDRCIMKIYQQQPPHDMQVLNRQHSQPLPPLKKVLSSQSMVLRNKFSSAPTVMVELPNAPIMNTRSVNDVKVEGIDKANQNVGPTTNVQPPPTSQPPPPLPLSTAAQAQCHIQGQGGMTPDDLDSDYDAESDTRPSRRSLPHKKRIPRKLKAPPARSIHTKCYKCNKCGESFNTQAAFSSHKIVHTAPTKQRPSANNLSTAFSCELCNKQFVSQLKFFEHLKHHYEPTSAGLNNNSINVNGVNIVNNGSNSSNNNASNSLPELTPAPIVATCIPPVTVHQQQQSLTQQSIGSVKSTGQVQPSTSPHNETAPSQPTIASAFSIKAELGQEVVKEEIVTSSGLACNQCGETFRKAKTLETHIATVHPRHEEIEEFSEPEDMMEGIRHVVNITNVDSGDEEHCGGNVVDDKVVRWRYQEVHDIGMEDLQDMCLPLPAASTLNNHHDNHNQHSGTIANTTAANDDANNLDDDDLVEDDNSNKIRSSGGGNNGIVSTASGRKKQLNCTQCERTFNHRNSLLYHIRSHSGQRPHQCEVCGKSFFSASALKVHMRLHSGDKPYKCEFCGRHFRQWGDLKYHVTSLHSEQKQFQCEYCGKDFARKYSLIVHRRIHTGEKNYRCEYCSKTFRASSYLQNHRRIHTGEKPHACDICGKPFRVRSDMKRHRQTHSRERPSSRTNNTTASSAAAVITSDQDDNSGGTETILPDNAMSTPLNLNIRQGDSNDGLTYSRTALERDGNTVYVWIPAQPEGNILSDE